MLTVALASSFVTIQNSRPIQAESLLYTTVCIVKGLLSNDCLPSQTTQTKPVSKDPPPTTSADPTDTTNPEAQSTTTAQPIVLDDTLTTQLPTIPDVQKTSTASSSSYTLPSSGGRQYSTAQVLCAHDTAAAIRATPSGWTIYGVAWYWWLLVLGSIVVSYIAIKLFITKLFLGIVK